jgi:hypothetical protein
VFLYEKKGVTFVSGTEFETPYKEVLLFEFNPSSDSFLFAEKDLAEINCQYSWRASTKKMIKESRAIKKGIIKGRKLSNGEWSISINIDTEFKFGKAKNSRKIDITRKIKTLPNKSYI